MIRSHMIKKMIRSHTLFCQITLNLCNKYWGSWPIDLCIVHLMFHPVPLYWEAGSFKSFSLKLFNPYPNYNLLKFSAT